jgi:ubiquinone/menaquinone biosynthesis C-methylase UbiE
MSASQGNPERERFDQWAKSYETSFLQWLLSDRVHKAVLARVPTGFAPTVILDIGCGTGRLIRRMHTLWPDARLVGIDLSEGMVVKAHQLAPFAQIYQAPVEELPLQSNSVDLVTSTVSFHHWQDQSQGILEITRVLRQKGIFILADPNIGHGYPMSRAQVHEIFHTSCLVVIKQVSILPLFSITVGENTRSLH